MASCSDIDYIVVYEHVHLINPEYTDGFWNQVDNILFEFKHSLEAQKNGASLGI